MGATSAHFTDAELRCRHCGVNGCTQELVDALEQLRSIVGRPISIDDAYRCPAHNKAVGGEPDSQHVLGNAADVKVAGMTAAQIERSAVLCRPIKGIGRDDRRVYLHVDVRSIPAKWCYGADGKQCRYYPAQ